MIVVEGLWRPTALWGKGRMGPQRRTGNKKKKGEQFLIRLARIGETKLRSRADQERVIDAAHRFMASALATGGGWGLVAVSGRSAATKVDRVRFVACRRRSLNGQLFGLASALSKVDRDASVTPLPAKCR